MDVVHGWIDLSDEANVVLTIGVFDGVHLGHQTLIRGAVRRARALGARAVVLTFHPHPRSVVAPDSPWGYLCSLEERITRIAELGPDLMMVLRFTPELAATPAEGFVQEVLHHIPVQELHVGADFVLGRGGRGDVSLLQTLGQRHGFAVHSIPPVCLDGQVVSSTRIRERVQAGRVAEAARWLGRDFCLRGSVVRGRRVGQDLGFPTANLYLHPRQILPADGVYAVWVRLPPADGWSSPQPGMAYVGRRPTFGPGERTVEVHLLGFRGDLLGRELRLAFVRHLRPDQAFGSPEQLSDQLHRDAARTRDLLTGQPPPG